MSPESAPAWDPERYREFSGERGRPFLDLLAQVGASSPRTVIDLGCGTGHLTQLLHDRWPEARIIGLDASAEMLAEAPEGTGIEFTVADIRDWAAQASVVESAGVDVVVANASLQWVPGHLELLPSLVGRVAPGGWLAFQVPGNSEAPSHTIRRELAAESPYAGHTVGVATPEAHDPATYLRELRRLGCEVDSWETTYLHVLDGPDAVYTWVTGTGARPTLRALPGELRASFEDEFRQRLRRAYPERDGVVVFPFRRVFVVARVHS